MGRKRAAAWIAEIFYEDNERFGRRSSRLPGLIAKVVNVVPHLFAMAFTNFASSYPKVASELEPEPRATDLAVPVALDTWPRHPATGKDRGLPYGDSVLASLDLGQSLSEVDDLVFVMIEVHRVCLPNASVSLRLLSIEMCFADPSRRRPILPQTIRFFTDDLQDEALRQKAAALSSSSLFSIEETGQGHMTLRVLKPDVAPLRTSRIDLGCGPAVREGYTGVDLIPFPGVEIVRDVDRHGLPLSDSTISHVHTAHFLEHVQHLVFVMNEIHRVCCHDAIVEISVPTLLGPHAGADPTHVRFFNARTLSYFESGKEPYAGITKGFQILEQRVGFSIEARLRVIKTP